MTTSNLHRHVQARLAEHDIRYTTGRRTAVSAMAEAGGPRSAAELHEDLGGSIPLSSLYRTFALLDDVGVVVPHFATKGLARYELAEWLTGHHHHLVCIECGGVEDVDVPDVYEQQVHSLVTSISSEVSFVPTNHALEIEGRCWRCA